MIVNTSRGTKRSTRVSAISTGVIGALVAFGVSGCSTGAESRSSNADLATTSAPVTSAAVTSAAVTSEAPQSFDAGSPCLLLNPDQVTALLDATPGGEEVLVAGTTMEACQFGDILELGIEVAQIPAEEWANSTPFLYEGILSLPEGSVAPSVLAQLEEAADTLKAGGWIESDKACEYFSYMLEASGLPAGTTMLSRYIPSPDSSFVMLSVQQCIGGVYSSIVVGRPDVADHPELIDTVQGFIADLG